MTLKTKGRQFDNFVVTGGSGSYRNDNLVYSVKKLARLLSTQKYIYTSDNGWSSSSEGIGHGCYLTPICLYAYMVTAHFDLCTLVCPFPTKSSRPGENQK